MLESPKNPSEVSEITTQVEVPYVADPRFPGNSWTLPTDITLVDPAAEQFVGRLVEAGWDKDSSEVYYLRIAFLEAYINAVAHGNLKVVIPEGSDATLGELARAEQKNNPTNKKIHVDIVIDAHNVSLIIRDEGDGFDWQDVPDPKQGEALLKPKGRGLLVMRSFFDSVTYNAKGNEVTMIKNR